MYIYIHTHVYVYISSVSDQNGVSPLYIMLEIHHSGREPSNIYIYIYICIYIYIYIYIYEFFYTHRYYDDYRELGKEMTKGDCCILFSFYCFSNTKLSILKKNN